MQEVSEFVVGSAVSPGADALLDGALVVGECVELVHQPLGMDPTQGMLTDVELPGVVTDHHRVAQEPVCAHRTPQRSLGGDAHRVGRHLQTGQTELFKMIQPGSVIGKLAPLMRGQSLDQRSGQGMLTHIVQGRIVDHIISVAGT